MRCLLHCKKTLQQSLHWKMKLREVDIKVKCIEAGLTQAQLAENIETTSSYVNRVVKKRENIINNTFVKIMEALEYVRQ